MTLVLEASFVISKKNELSKTLHNLQLKIIHGWAKPEYSLFLIRLNGGRLHEH